MKDVDSFASSEAALTEECLKMCAQNSGVHACARNDDDPNSAEVTRAVSDFERMDMFLISTHEDIAQMTAGYCWR